jgi:hypothetical protein
MKKAAGLITGCHRSASNHFFILKLRKKLTLPRPSHASHGTVPNPWQVVHLEWPSPIPSPEQSLHLIVPAPEQALHLMT